MRTEVGLVGLIKLINRKIIILVFIVVLNQIALTVA